MSDNVVPFKRPEPVEPDTELVPHSQGEAKCIDCKHTWQAVIATADYHANDNWMECPACSLMKGRFYREFVRGSLHWTCHCGGDLFHINDKFIYCANCGREQNFK